MAKHNNTEIETTESITKQIWLAGIGAYGQGFDEAVEHYNKANEKTSQIFNDLVKAGAEIESSTRLKIKELKTDTRSKLDEIKAEKVNARINNVRKKLGLNDKEPSTIERLEAKVDALTDLVNALAKQQSV